MILAFGACDSRNDIDTSRSLESDFAASVRASAEEEGRRAYATYCAGCHGLKGDGKGEAAVFLHPAPRDFQLANFKFSSTRAGQLPTDEDLGRTITDGLRGSAMPGWNLLPAGTVTALVAYIKTFSGKWNERAAAPQIPFVDDPYRSLSDKLTAIWRGEAVYHGFAACWSCHPAYVSRESINTYRKELDMPVSEGFRAALFESEGKPNTEGETIFPPNFRRDFVRAGSGVADLYRSIAAGITGTAMPTWIDSMDIPTAGGDTPLVSRADLWAMAYYVQSLITQRPAKLAETDVKIRDRAQPIRLDGSLSSAVEVQEFIEDEEFEDG